MLRWGATDEELRQPLPGDDLAPHPLSLSTRAITIDASASAIWPWLAQIGYHRGGWYSFDFVERALFSGTYVEKHSARRIHPELQQLQVGVSVPFGPGVAIPITALEPGRHLVIGKSWAFVLDHRDEQHTRLIVRSRGGMLPPMERLPGAAGRLMTGIDRVLTYVIYEPFHFVMEREMLLGIKRRAEGRYAPGTRRFLDRVRQFNKRALNPAVLALTRRWSGGYAILHHIGRRSGKRYSTPVVAIPTAEGFVIPMPYGADTDWCRNVLAAGGCVIQWKGKTYQASEPQVLDLASARAILPPLYRRLLPLVRISQVLRVRRVPMDTAQDMATGPYSQVGLTPTGRGAEGRGSVGGQ
jgi:deazaflavin-dependent oxidoreductase (nitroreductase family)